MFSVGDMVKKAKNISLDKGIGIVVRIWEHDNGTDMYDLFFVEWLHSNEQYPYEAKELTLVSRVQ
jgi:hypothetical protein